MNENSPEIFPGTGKSDQLLDALARVLASETFAEVFRLKKFLEYSVNATIAGHGDRLKGFVIACEVFEKEDPSDAQTTTVVRVEAGRLRRRLKDYYETEGINDPIRIRMPKGGYSTTFTATGKSAAAGSMPVATATRKPIHRQPFVWIVALVLLALLYFFPWMKEPDVTGDPVVLPDTHPTIAVMPFGNLTGEDRGDSFATGLTEDIVIDLGTIAALDVISISSVMQYKGLQLTPGGVGAQLGVEYILEGTVRRLPPNLRVTARLSDTGTGLQLWAERFDSQAGDELALQEELARKVVSSLSINLPEGETDRFGQRYTQSKPAWFLFKQAMNLANPPSDPARLELALRAFDQVSVIDPGFAGGFAGSAYIRSFMVFFGHSQDPDVDRKAALELAARARKIDASFGLTYSAMAFIHLSQRQFEEALAMSSRAIEIQPSDPYVTVYHGINLALNGDIERGIEYSNRALRLDPLNVRTPYLNIIGLLNYLAGHYDEALKALLRNQERGGPIGLGQMQFLAATYSKLGNFAMAESTLIIAGDSKSGISRSEKGLLNAFRDPAIPQRLLDEIEVIRTRAGLQH
jgi:TolB-like protein